MFKIAIVVLGLTGLGVVAYQRKPDPLPEPGPYGYWRHRAIDGSIVTFPRNNPPSPNDEGSEQ